MVSGPDKQEWYERWGDRDRSPADHKLTGAYRLLAVLMLVSIAAALLLPENHLVQQFAPNAATEVFGIIITLAFVQQLLYRQERARRMRSSIGAYRRAGWALTRLVSVWADTVKGCHRGEDVPGSLERLFAPHVTEVLVNLSPVVSTGGEELVPWVRRLGAEIEAATAQLNHVVLSYSSVLDPSYTEAVDEIIDHPFARYIERGAHAHASEKAWRTSMNLNRGHREDYFQHLVATVQLHNSLAAEAATVRSRGRAPRTGTLGMELSRDHDLHVSTEFGKAWRSAAPRQGSLCNAAGQS
ncbi:hypothetical protein BH23GEM10_BH23GEM10_01270 [soil metagenome]